MVKAVLTLWSCLCSRRGRASALVAPLLTLRLTFFALLQCVRVSVYDKFHSPGNGVGSREGMTTTREK
ncbi:hypothetical protein VNO78_33109 [Psophocarpus tetragonolobus]|uniref:Uncharacterized protein n=1 Tax=Psophocarpus tetragonolobus TaxID=3891 RepID=A0AAN9NWF8_PSOTE